MPQPWEQFQQQQPAPAAPQAQPWEAFGGQPAPSLFDRIAQDWANRSTTANTQADQAVARGADLGSAARIGITKVAGDANDIVKETIKSGVDAIPDSVKQAFFMTPQGMMMKSMGQALAPVADAAKEKYAAFEEAHPITGSYLDATGNLVQAGTNASMAIPALNATRAGLADTLLNSGREAMTANRNGFVQDLITPKLTPGAKVDQFANSTQEGILNRNVPQPTPRQQGVIDTVASTGVKPGNSLIQNRTILENEIGAEGQKLQQALQDSGVQYKDHVTDIADDASKRMLDNPNLIQLGGEDGQQVVLSAQARAVANKAQALLASNPATPEGVLAARQQLDKWALTKKTGVFDKDSLMGDALRDTRNSMNDYIASTVPDADVTNSLTRQSHLYDAVDAINSKGAMEAPTRVGRAIQGVTDMLPDTKLGKAAAGATAAGLGAAGLASVPIAAPLGAIIGAGLLGKAAMSPTTRVILGRILGAK